jgi:phenylalanyl-tRNA synthetase alpha chain
LIDQIKAHLAEVEAFQSTDAAEIESFRTQFLGKKGILTDLFAAFKDVPNDQKKAFGQQINALKMAATAKLEESKQGTGPKNKSTTTTDFSRPGQPIEVGALHPISILRNQVIDIFSRIGFTLSAGPEIEDDWHNFTALNLPEHHPARDMQDTFFVQTNPDILLRTHTSSVQVRHMEANTPPMRTLSPGRVFRNEDISARSHCVFHQVEGLYIDKNVSFADLKQTLLYMRDSFDKELELRFRPSYFPFTEPSAEVDIRSPESGEWLEILGCGMVHPNVLKGVDIDPEEFIGFAFGIGLDRLAMLYYGIPDLRMMFANDLHFLEQF